MLFLTTLLYVGCSKDSAPTKPAEVPETSVDEQGTARITTNEEGMAIIHTNLLGQLEFAITNESGAKLDSIAIEYFEETGRYIMDVSDPRGVYAGFFFWGDLDGHESRKAGTVPNVPLRARGDAAGITLDIILFNLSEISTDQSPYEARTACQELDPLGVTRGVRFQYGQGSSMLTCGQIVEYIRGQSECNTALLSIGLREGDMWPGSEVSTAMALRIDKTKLLSFTGEQASEYVLAWLDEKRASGWGRIDAATQFIVQEIRTEYETQDGHIALLGLDLHMYGGAPEAPMLYWPADSGTVNEDALFFVWSEVAAAVSYEIEFQSRQEFPPVIITYDHLTATQFAPPEPLNAQIWYWQVRATDGDGNVGAWSEARSLTVVSGSSALIDIDGNIYRTVTIGGQVWMAENLKVLHYRNGDPIEDVTGNAEWVALTQGARCDYSNSPDHVSTYGRLYNWYATQEARGLAPEGWHVPSDEEWQTLIDYLGGPAVAGGKMKETGTAHWNANNVGATNETGFTALPGGELQSWGPVYGLLGIKAWFWSSSPGITGGSYFYMSVENGNEKLYRSEEAFGSSYSVRCIHD